MMVSTAIPPNPKARRISYVIPPPSDPPRRLVLPALDVPRYGRTSPLVQPMSGTQTPTSAGRLGLGSYFSASPLKHPRHRLGVTALALDTSTCLSGRLAPEGILYSGGRDGLIIAWEQGISTKKRKERYGARAAASPAYHWESMTGWEDDVLDDDEDEEWLDTSETTEPHIPYEERWAPDYDALDAASEASTATFRQCVQAHTDWINDIVLCNYNRTIVSASNDGTLKAWNPHATSTDDLMPTVIGDHMDYVRCVVYSRERNWVASGSFDRTVKIWDLQQSRAEPISTLALPDSDSSAKASVYALSTHPSGNLIAAGSPERVVRLWDSRTGRKVHKLVGHTDNIRSLLLSEDGKYLLSGSSDATVKLWSLTAQRCLHTFTHHADSVWSLSSNHPELEVFYSGDRSGIVCKVDVEGCEDLADGECVMLCRDMDDAEDAGRGADGINRIVALDDHCMWTATGSSSIRRWGVPRRRFNRLQGTDALSGKDEGWGLVSVTSTHSQVSSSPVDSFNPRTGLISEELKIPGRPESPRSGSFHMTHRPRFSTQSTLSAAGTVYSTHTAAPIDRDTQFGIPYSSLVMLSSPRELYSHTLMPPAAPRLQREAEIATLYSAASVRSVPALHSHILPQSSAGATPNRSQAVSPNDAQRDASARAAYEERDLAIDASPWRSKPEDVIQGSHGLVRSVILNDRLHALTVDTAGEVALWDIVRGACIGVYASEDVGPASSAGSSLSGNGKERSPREALETVQERIEGEAMCAAWSTVDTKIGHLTVHLAEGRCFDAEIYTDEAGFAATDPFPEDHKLNIGKWVLANLFAGFVRREIELIAQNQSSNGGPRVSSSSAAANASSTPAGIVRGAAPSHISLGPAEGRRLRSASDISNVMRTPGGHGAGHPARTPAILLGLPGTVESESEGNHTRGGTLTPTTSGAPHHKLTFLKENALTPIPASPLHPVTPAGSSTIARTPSTVGKDPGDYFAGKGRARSGSSANETQDEVSAAQIGPTTPGAGGFMGRFRNFGKSSKRPPSGDVTSAPIVEDKDGLAKDGDISGSSAISQRLKLLNNLLSQDLAPVPQLEAPTVEMPPEVAIMISEEAADAGGWTAAYSSLVSKTQDETDRLEMAAPVWLLELLLLNKSPQAAVSKVSFVVVAYEKRHEPVSDASRLTAGRILRVRKVLQYVCERLETNEKPAPAATKTSGPLQETAGNPKKTSITAEVNTSKKPEEIYELVCNEVVLPLTMTIGAIRHYVWRQGGELTMYYRPIPPAGTKRGGEGASCARDNEAIITS